MVRTLGLIELPELAPEATDDSPRIAAMYRTLDGRSWLELLLRRVAESARLEAVLLLAPTEEHAEEIRRHLPADFRVETRLGDDPLSRFAAAVRDQGADAVVRVLAGHPFVESVLIDRLVNTAQHRSQCDYVGYFAARGRATLLERLGMMAEWVRAESVLLADLQARDADDRQDVTRFVCCHPELFQLRLIPLPPQFERRDVRLALRSEEDWEHLQVLWEALGPDRLDWTRITGLLDENPRLRDRMAHLNRSDAR